MGATLPKVESPRRYRLYRNLQQTLQQIAAHLQINVIDCQPAGPNWQALCQLLTRQLAELELPPELVQSLTTDRELVHRQLQFLEAELTAWFQFQSTKTDKRRASARALWPKFKVQMQSTGSPDLATQIYLDRRPELLHAMANLIYNKVNAKFQPGAGQQINQSGSRWMVSAKAVVRVYPLKVSDLLDLYRKFLYTPQAAAYQLETPDRLLITAASAGDLELYRLARDRHFSQNIPFDSGVWTAAARVAAGRGQTQLVMTILDDMVQIGFSVIYIQEAVKNTLWQAVRKSQIEMVVQLLTLIQIPSQPAGMPTLAARGDLVVAGLLAVQYPTLTKAVRKAAARSAAGHGHAKMLKFLRRWGPVGFGCLERKILFGYLKAQNLKRVRLQLVAVWRRVKWRLILAAAAEHQNLEIFQFCYSYYQRHLEERTAEAQQLAPEDMTARLNRIRKQKVQILDYVLQTSYSPRFIEYLFELGAGDCQGGLKLALRCLDYETAGIMASRPVVLNLSDVKTVCPYGGSRKRINARIFQFLKDRKLVDAEAQVYIDDWLAGYQRRGVV